MNRFSFDELHREAGSPSILRLAEIIGHTPRTLHRWKNAGVPASKADAVAIKVGSHPANIWPDQWINPS